MCLMGLYLVGSLFGGLCGFVTKRIAFRDVAAGAVPYSSTLFALDGLMVWRRREGGRERRWPARPFNSSFLIHCFSRWLD